MFTSKDVARVAGVSQSTVSYVMSGKRPISEKTRKRVLAAIEELTYQPNAGARALASQRTQVIGLVVPFGSPGSDSAGLLPFIETIAASARARDHDVLLVTTDEGSAGLTRLAGRALCDAIVMMDIRTHDERVPVAASLRVPVILIGVPADPMGLTCVDVEFEHMARLAVDELVATGHDRLVLLGYTAEVVSKDVNYVRRLIESARVAAAGHGRLLEVVSPIEWGLDGARIAVKAALAGGAGPRTGERVGLVVADSHAISSVLAALVEQGLVPGRDVSVIGVATDDAAQAMTPALTNVSLEPRDVSRRAMDLLFRLVEPAGDRPVAERPSAVVELVRPRLTRRQTVMPAPVPAPRAASPAAAAAPKPSARRRTTH